MQNFDLKSVYLLTGLTSNGNKKVFLVKEENKDVESERFKVESVHIFSIQSASIPVSMESLIAANSNLLKLGPFDATKYSAITNQVDLPEANPVKQVIEQPREEATCDKKLEEKDFRQPCITERVL